MLPAIAPVRSVLEAEPGAPLGVHAVAWVIGSVTGVRGGVWVVGPIT